MPYIGIIALLALPFVLELIFKKKFSGFLLSFYLGFIFFAAFLGMGWLYRIWAPYDKVVHSAFGYVGCVVGLLLICKLEDYNKLSAPFVCIMCFAVSLCCGAIWEIIEFTVDAILGQYSQGAPVMTIDGNIIVGLSDSMFDLICNLGGALLFALNFLLHKVTGKNFLIKSLVSEFARKTPR